MLLITPMMISRGVSAVMMASVFVNFWSSTLTYSASLSGEKISVDRILTTSVYTYLLYGAGAIISPQLVGKIQDSQGYRASMFFILALQIVFVTMVIILNEIHIFNWWAYLCMFGLGMLDNCMMTFINIVLGFEFESKIIPFSAKNFIEGFTVFFVVGALSIFDIEGKGSFRAFYVFFLVFALASTLLMFRFPFKESKKADK